MVVPDAVGRGSFSGRAVGAYRIHELIGRGGMGEVYRADDTRLGRTVAVKVLPDRLADQPGSRKRFLREARYACRVVHPYVATVFDVLEEDERVFLVMEHIEGRRLDVVLRTERPDLRRVTEYALEMAEAVGAIHRVGLVHRDLKPGNVMVTPSGHVKVMDFGIARPLAPPELRVLGQASKDSTLTDEPGLVGTLLYMSPEQVRRDPVDYRSDLFTFGTILYEAITGEHPFARESALATATAILGEPPGRGTEPKTLSESGPLREIVLRLLEKNPHERLPDAQTLVDALRSVQKGEPLEIAPAPSLTRKGWVVASGVAAGALAIVALVVLGPEPGSGGARSGGAAGSEPRPTLIVLPLRAESSAAKDESLRAATVASMLRAGLAQSSALQVVGSMRTQELLEGMDASVIAEPARLRPLLDATSARYLVTGDLSRDPGGAGGALVASMEIYDREHPDAGIGLRVRANSLPVLVDDIARQVRGRLAQGDRTTEGSRVSIAAIESPSEPALLAAESGRRAAGRGDLEEADRQYGEAVAEDPRYVNAYKERAKTLYQAGYVTRAKEAIQKAIDEARSASRPTSARLLKELEAVRCRVQEDREGEQRALEDLTARYPDEADLWSELALAQTLANRFPNALASIDRALALSARDPRYMLQRAYALRQMRRFSEADLAFTEAERWDATLPGRPLRDRLLFNRGLLESDRKNYALALELFDEAAKLQKSGDRTLRLAETRRGIALTHLLQGRLTEAAASLERATAEFNAEGSIRQEAVCLDILGALRHQAGRLDEAETLLRRAVVLTRESGGELPPSTPMLNLASLLNDAGRSEEAAPLAKEGLDLARRRGDKRRQATGLTLVGECESSRGEFDKAMQSYGEAISLLPPNDDRAGWPLGGMAEVELYRGRLVPALDAASREISLKESAGKKLDAGFGYVRRAGIRRRAGDVEGFRSDLDSAEKIARVAGEARDLVARCELQKGLFALQDGDDHEAESWLRKVVTGGPTSASVTPAAKGALALVLCRTRRSKEGLPLARRALDESRLLGDRILAMVDLAASLGAAGHDQEARKASLRALDEAEASGMLWETARAASVAAALPRGARPTGVEEVRERGRKALDGFLESCPGGANGRAAGLRDVRLIRAALGA